jgi:putative ABC transport system permease protein
MVVMRRSAELTVRRARGDSLRQIAAATAGGAAVACVPAAIAAVILAVAVVSGPIPPGWWWPPLAVLAAAICAPAAVAAWQQRLPRHRGRGRQRARVRLVVEVTAIAAAVAGVVVFRQQGMQAGESVNLFTSAAPVLIAIPAVIVVLRVYPLVLRGLLRGYARRPGATAFLGLARAARTALTPALPAFVLVLALTVAAFAGMVRDAVTRGEVTASWQATGADASIMASSQQATGAALSPAAVRALAAVPGVTHAARVWQEGWTTPDGTRVTGLAVDPAEYATLVAATQTFPAVPAGLLTAAATGAPQPVLASPQAAADLGADPVTLTSGAAVRPVKVQLARVLSGTPALPAGGEFVIMPLAAIHSTATPPEPTAALVNELLLTGTGIDQPRLTALANDEAPGSVATFRSDELKALTTAPLQRATFQLFGLALVVAAVLGLAVMLLELALGAAEREATLARLATMGLGEGQRTRVVALEVLPAVLAAAVAAWICAVALPRLVAPAMDLSVFTGSTAAVPLTPDTASIAVPLAGLAVVALVALAVEIRSGRRRVAAKLRIDG